MTKRETDFWYMIVRMLPKKLVYFCFMHVMTHSTTGKYSDTVVPELSGVDAAKRYAKDNGIS